VPAVRAALGGLAGRRVQTIVIGVVVAISTATSTLALGLLADANAPFDQGFAAQHGAHVTAVVDPARVTAGQLDHVPGVTAAAGPFPEATVTGQTTFRGIPGAFRLPPVTLVGRSSPGGPVDDIDLDSGRWVRRTGEVVVSRDIAGPTPALGQRITVGGVQLTVVGIAKSITDTADGWVEPGEIPALRVRGAPEESQMLYQFASAGTNAAISADTSAIKKALPAGALLGAQSYLSVKLQVTSSIAPWVPFIVAFGLIGLVMSVLIVANVVSGTVVAGTRRIGVLKSIGFTPAQVVAAYVLQVAVPAVIGCVLGTAGGNLLSLPLLGQTAHVFGVGALAVPVWVDLAVPLAMLVLAGIAALLPALRAGRLSAVRAIATGRAPRPRRGYAAHRVLGRVRGVPRPVTIGLASPFARPARTLVTLTAILLGGTAAIFAVGLSTSLNRAELDLSHAQSEPVQVALPEGFTHIGKPGAPVPRLPSPAAQRRAVEAALRAQPGTARYVAEADDDLSVLGLSHTAAVHAFDGDASWTGYALISGGWYHGTGEADVNTYFLSATGKRVGDTFTLTPSGVTVRIAGEVFLPGNNGGAEILTSLGTLARVEPNIVPRQYDVSLRPGTSPQAYANALGHALGPDYDLSLNGTDPLYVSLIGLVAALTLLLVAVAGLGVLNTVALQIRERVHDLGVFKAVGMTPRQVLATVVSSVAGIGLVAGVIAIPAGLTLHHLVLPAMGNAGQTAIPASLLNVYLPWELALLALSGVVIAAAGALAPASWAARSRPAAALRAE
jgi:putative ABC transport system permease protein